MTLSGDDLKRLRGALILLVVLAGAGAAAVHASLNYVQAQRAATRAAEQFFTGKPQQIIQMPLVSSAVVLMGC